MEWRHIITILGLLLSGCAEYRGIPTHGGGKRFDEEQRVVAGAVRQSVADMELNELRGQKVQIILECIAQDGGGSIYFPGFNGINAGISGNVGTGNLVQINQAIAGNPRLTNDNYNNNVNGNVGVSYNPMLSYAATAMSTNADLGYLKAALEMKALHAGLTLVLAEPDVVLNVIVDVLGTNRSHSDSILSSCEKLSASCEATYYARNAKNGQMVFEARRVSSASTYRETRAFGVKGAVVDRSIERTDPTPLPVDAQAKPSTQPAITKQKSWFDAMITSLADD